jgi:hypothetical protein
MGDDGVAKGVIDSVEKILIASALGFSHVAAQRLGYSPNTLTRKIREFALWSL